MNHCQSQQKKNDKPNLLDKSLDIITSLIAYLIICSFPLLVHLGILATSYEHSKIYGTIMTILYILTPIILFYYFIPFSLLSAIITTYAALILIIDEGKLMLIYRL